MSDQQLNQIQLKEQEMKRLDNLSINTQINRDIFSDEEYKTHTEFSKLSVEKQDDELKTTIRGTTILKLETRVEKEWYKRQEIPSDEQITKEIEADYKNAYGKNIGWNERIKAKKEYKKKLKTMQKMREETRAAAYELVKKQQVVKDIVIKSGKKIRDEYQLLGLFKPGEEQGMKDFMSAAVLDTYDVKELDEEEQKKVIQKENKIREEKKLNALSKEEEAKLIENEKVHRAKLKEEDEKNRPIKLKEYEKIIERFEKDDMSDFQYNSFEELVKKAPKLKEKAFIGGVLRSFLSEFDRVGVKLGAERKTNLLLKIDFYETMTATLDPIIEVYSSPYYVTLRSKTMDNMSAGAINDLFVYGDTSKSMTYFLGKVMAVKNFQGFGRQTGNDFTEPLQAGEKPEDCIDKLRKRRDIVGLGVMNGKSLEELELMRTPTQNYPTIVTLKKDPTCPPGFDDNCYEMYKKVRVTNQRLRHPDIVKLLGTHKSFRGESIEASRAGGLFLRTVTYNDKWEPVTEQDRINHEWNMEFAKTFNALSEGDDSLNDKMNEMVQNELPQSFAPQMNLPDPSVFDDLRESIVNGGPVECKWIDEQLANPEAFCDLESRTLTYKNAKNYFKDQMAKFEQEHPEAVNMNNAASIITNIVNYYTSAKYGFKLEYGYGAKLDGIGKFLLNAEFLDENIKELKQLRKG